MQQYDIDNITLFELFFLATKEESYLLGRRMRVNGRNVLSLDFSQNYKMEKIYDDHTKFMLKIMVSKSLLSQLLIGDMIL